MAKKQKATRQDATVRNVRASHRRDGLLEDRMRLLERRQDETERLSLRVHTTLAKVLRALVSVA